MPLAIQLRKGFINEFTVLLHQLLQYSLRKTFLTLLWKHKHCTYSSERGCLSTVTLASVFTEDHQGAQDPTGRLYTQVLSEQKCDHRSTEN